MSDRLDRLEALAETILLAIQQQKEQQDDLRAQQDRDRQDWRAGIDDVVGMVGTIAQRIDEIQTEVRGLQIENRRILDHLFVQQQP
jgi:soluble cytochrome b562